MFKKSNTEPKQKGDFLLSNSFVFKLKNNWALAKFEPRPICWEATFVNIRPTTGIMSLLARKQAGNDPSRRPIQGSHESFACAKGHDCEKPYFWQTYRSFFLSRKSLKVPKNGKKFTFKTISSKFFSQVI